MSNLPTNNLTNNLNYELNKEFCDAFNKKYNIGAKIPGTDISPQICVFNDINFINRYSACIFNDIVSALMHHSRKNSVFGVYNLHTWHLHDIVHDCKEKQSQINMYLDMIKHDPKCLSENNLSDRVIHKIHTTFVENISADDIYVVNCSPRNNNFDSIPKDAQKIDIASLLNGIVRFADYSNGSARIIEMYFENGKINSYNDHPAIVLYEYSNPSNKFFEVYMQNSKFHRKNKPAFIIYENNKIVGELYAENGVYTRGDNVDLPAISYFHYDQQIMCYFNENNQISRKANPAYIVAKNIKPAANIPFAINLGENLYPYELSWWCDGLLQSPVAGDEQMPGRFVIENDELVTEYYINGKPIRKSKEHLPAKFSNSMFMYTDNEGLCHNENVLNAYGSILPAYYYNCNKTHGIYHEQYEESSWNIHGRYGRISTTPIPVYLKISSSYSKEIKRCVVHLIKSEIIKIVYTKNTMTNEIAIEGIETPTVVYRPNFNTIFLKTKTQKINNYTITTVDMLNRKIYGRDLEDYNGLCGATELPSQNQEIFDEYLRVINNITTEMEKINLSNIDRY